MLFTIILDYDGGTYISQTVARGPVDLLSKIENAIDWDAIVPKVSRRAKRLFAADLDTNIVPVDTVSQVWCVTGRIGRKLALIHVVNTVRAPGRRSRRGRAASSGPRG